VFGRKANTLWQKAMDSLPTDDKLQWQIMTGNLSENGTSSMNAYSSTSEKLAVLSDILVAVEEKKQLCMQRRWRLKKSNGDVIIIRDLCDKTLAWVNKFKEVGDAVAQFDPVHISLPWAGVRFFIQVSSDVGSPLHR
jgi:hypothetical protein